jgi:hypothetical protein
VAQGHQGIDGQHALRGHNGGDRHKRFADGQGGAAFGRVVEGLDVIRKIQQQPVKGQILSRNEPSDKPGTIQLSRIVSAPIDVDVDTAASTIVTIQEDSLTAMAGLHGQHTLGISDKAGTTYCVSTMAPEVSGHPGHWARGGAGSTCSRR